MFDRIVRGVLIVELILALLTAIGFAALLLTGIIFEAMEGAVIPTPGWISLAIMYLILIPVVYVAVTFLRSDPCIFTFKWNSAWFASGTGSVAIVALAIYSFLDFPRVGGLPIIACLIVGPYLHLLILRCRPATADYRFDQSRVEAS
jgi:hypothetical protein